jgi:hypothetical protein
MEIMELITCLCLGSLAQATHVVEMCILRVIDQNAMPQNLLVGTEENHEKLVTVVGRSTLAVVNSRARQKC